MRIALFAHRPGQRQPTGIGRYLRELVPALGHLVEERDDVLIASTREAHPANWVRQPAHTHILPWPRAPAHAAWCLGTGPTLERSAGTLDVTHLIQPFPPVRTASAQVVTVHDLFPVDHPAWYRRSERWTYRRSVELMLRRATRFVVPSRYVAGELKEVLGVQPSRIEVVPHGVSGTFCRPRSQRDIEGTCARFGIEPGRFVVCLGAIEERKNAVPVIRAFAALNDQKVPLVMVGADEHGANAVKSEIARQDRASRVYRTGYLSDEDTAALVQGAAVLVHPALAEGFGLVPLEAMAAGTPVIAARTSSIPEVVADAGVLVDEATSPHAWAGALKEVLRSPEHRAALAAAGEERAASFNWDHAAKAMLEIYKDVARV